MSHQQLINDQSIALMNINDIDAEVIDDNDEQSTGHKSFVID